MRPISTLALLLVSGLPSAAQPADRLVAVSNVLDILNGEDVLIGQWTLDPALDPDVYKVEVEGSDRARRVCFLSGPNALCRIVGVGDAFDFIVEYDGVDHPTRVVGAPPAAVFDEAYRKAHRGTISVLVPEVYELVNVAIALTPFVDEDENAGLVYTSSPYHAAVQEHFGHLSGHPFVSWLDAEMRRAPFNYFRHKMSGYSFEFDPSGRIVGSPVYTSTNFRGDTNSLLPVVGDMQSFSDSSGFRSFYTEHRDLYEEQEAFFRDSIDTDRMLGWLRREFPEQRPYDHVKVVFSPLVYANQSVNWFKTDGFSELQPHINFPYPPNGLGGYASASVLLTRGDLLFTEINHGFMNLASDRYASEIAESISNRALWARAGTPSDSYSNAQSVFNEMMNWGLVELYYMDYAPATDLARLHERIRTFMRERRGFERYPAFAEHLVELYRSRPEGTTVADLYPDLITWVSERDRQGSAGGPRR